MAIDEHAADRVVAERPSRYAPWNATRGSPPGGYSGRRDNV